MKFFNFIIPIIIFFTFGCRNQNSEQYVLMISFDGFRSDYIDWYETPNIDKFVSAGVISEGLIPVFVSKTFPNHYSIATGLYVENHGLIGNHFYDPVLNDNYSLSNRKKVEDPRFYAGEPIWVTAEKNGIKTASYFWVGSEAPIMGTYPSKWKRYEHNFPFESRIDSVVSWLALPEKERPRLSLLYFHEPDETGHNKGPKSKETEQKVMQLDSLFGDLIRKLKVLEVSSRLNIIILSDHGMTEISSDRTIDISKHIDISNVKQEGSGPYSFLFDIDDSKKEKLVKSLNEIPHLKAYEKINIPNRYHFKNHHRIKEVLLIADEGWYIKNQAISSRSSAGAYIPKGGTHGYDNQLKSMHALFAASGPMIKSGLVVPPFENVNIYPLICQILNIPPNEKIDGKVENIIHILDI